MNSQEKRTIKIKFPWGLYFQQLFSTDIYVKFINPFDFWRRYRIDHLENCRAINIVQRLEYCLQIEWQPTQSDKKLLKNLSKINSYQGLIWEKKPQNTILITQPSFKLQYRGVTYFTGSIVGINANQLAINRSSIIQIRSEKLANSPSEENLGTSSNI